MDRDDYNKNSALTSAAVPKYPVSQSRLEELPKTRIGGDLSYHVAGFLFESDVIKVNVEEDIQGLEQYLDIYYPILGYHVSEQLLIYGGYWFLDAHTALPVPGNVTIEDDELEISTLGASHDLMDRIRLKAQYSRITIDGKLQKLSQGIVINEPDKGSIFGVTVSVIF